MWYRKKDLKYHQSIVSKNLHGFVLPHAGTEYTGAIISHTLRFKPQKQFTTVVIIYYPVSKKPNVFQKYYHEYYVPMKCLKHAILHFWNIKRNIKFQGVNVATQTMPPTLDQASTLYIVSADFSHYLSLQSAIELENKAAHSLLFRQFSNPTFMNVVDHPASFKALYSSVPKSWNLQWIGRTRSPGEKGVGYLSFLLKSQPIIQQDKKPIHGIFVTAFDKHMNYRECQGSWFYEKPWSKQKETNLITKVLKLATTTSRLTNGQYRDIPLSHYTITYLFLSKKKFIRGHHGIKYNSFYLPDILLENTFTNGSWITPKDTEWKFGNFRMNETLQKLNTKSGFNDTSLHYQLYDTEVVHHKIGKNMDF